MKLERIKEFDRETMKLTEFCRSTQPDEKSVMKCDNISEFQSAKSTAYCVRDEKRKDGYKYVVSLNTSMQSVTVSLTKT